MLCPGVAMTLDKIVRDNPTISPDGQRLDIGTKDTERFCDGQFLCVCKVSPAHGIYFYLL